MSRLLIAFVMLQIVGCASYFKKKDCESVNWFAHGQSVAMRGQWLNSDALVSECRKVEADIQESQLDLGFKSGMQKYCSIENAYSVGKNGDTFARDICEGPQINALMSGHQRGVRDYCDKANGFNAGSSGKKYQNICPKDLEGGFLPEYRKGRRKYVQTLIDTKSQDIRDLEGSISSKRQSLSYARGALSGLQNQKVYIEAQKSSLSASGNTSLVSHYDMQLGTLNTDISQKQSVVYSEERELRSLEAKRDQLATEVSGFKSELPGLEQP